MKIAVVGAGYVGFSIAVLLSQKNEVVLLDIKEERINLINKRKSPIADKEIEDYLENKPLNLISTLDSGLAYKNANFIIVATQTDYDEDKNYFNTSTVENVIKEAIKFSPNSSIVIKSTIPIGFTEKLMEYTGYKNILFSPEFLREGKALYDNLYPTRIVVGFGSEETKERALVFANLLKENVLTDNVKILLTGLKEAESIKLFSNTYLALRVAFFNELDSFAKIKGLNTKEIIDGLSLDPRIGNHYNNPSFGYGGYCLPKDTRQLLANFEDVPNNIIKAIVTANATRKQFIADEILNKNYEVIGIYRLTMKSGSDNFRHSSILDIIKFLKNNGKEIIIFEPQLSFSEFLGCKIISDLDEFKSLSSIILANRFDEELNDSKEKIYSRDLFFRD